MCIRDRFFSVPNVRNYVHRQMVVRMMADMPVLTIRQEPLSTVGNKFLKRTFDILFSALFLVTCFWWIYIIVAIITKITMPFNECKCRCRQSASHEG